MMSGGDIAGLLIRQARLGRDWSQAGLCKGICTVSYLSKIESGRAEPSEEILRLLLARLNLETNREVEREAAGLAERSWELLLTGRRGQLHGLLRERDIERYRAVPAWLDLALLSAQTPLEPALEPCMDVRQLAVQRILQRQEAEAVRLMPNAYTHLMLGIADYNAGSYSAAVDALQTAYDLAGREGAVRLMLEAKLFLGNAYCNRQDLPNMERHYRVGRRLAEDLQDESALRAIGYNTASAWIETGRYEEAYAWFSGQEQPTLMALHKLAICHEQLGHREQALAAVQQAEPMASGEMEQRMLALVRYRLEHPDYLHDDTYGTQLLDCFQRLRDTYPMGFTRFHLPWVLAWYKANRQYRQACRLLEEFPVK